MSFSELFNERQSVYAHNSTIIPTCERQIVKAAEIILYALENGKKLLFFGNGGSACIAEHLSGEINGRFLKERKGYPSISLFGLASLTAIANDYGYDAVFSRQIDALGHPGDIAIGLTTSGNSKNVINGLETAKAKGLLTIVFTGAGGTVLKHTDFPITAMASSTAVIQELHLSLGHILIEIIDEQLK